MISLFTQNTNICMFNSSRDIGSIDPLVCLLNDNVKNLINIVCLLNDNVSVHIINVFNYVFLIALKKQFCTLFNKVPTCFFKAIKKTYTSLVV